MPAVSPSPQQGDSASSARQGVGRPPAHEMTRASKQLKKESERSGRPETRGAGGKPSSARDSSKSGPPPPPVAGREVVGCEVSIWSASRAVWKKATIEEHDPAQARHLVRFREREGGAEEAWLDLGRTRFQWAPRARIPANPTAARAPPDAALVGSRVKIFWPGMARWYLGRVERWDPKTRRHTVRYRDGDVRNLALKYEAVQYLGPERKDCEEGGKKERGDRDAGRTPAKKVKSGGGDRAASASSVKKASDADEGGLPPSSAAKPGAARRRPSEPSRLGKPLSKSAKRLYSPGEAQVSAAKKARRGVGAASEESEGEESSSESSSSGDEFEAPSRGPKRLVAKGGKASKTPGKSARKEPMPGKPKISCPSDEPSSRSASPGAGAPAERGLEAEAGSGAGGAAMAKAAELASAPASFSAAAQATPSPAGASPRAPTPSAGLDVLGCRVSVECGPAAVRGRVVQFDSYHKRHKVVFDTGEEDWLSLSRERFLWLLPRAGREPVTLRAVAQAMAVYGAEELGPGATRMLGGPGSGVPRLPGGSGAHPPRLLGVSGPGRPAGKSLKTAKTTGALGRSSGSNARLGTSKSLPAPAGRDSQPGTPQGGGNLGVLRAQGGVAKHKPATARPALPGAAFCLERRRCLGSLHAPEGCGGDAPAPGLDAGCVGRRLALRCAGSGAWHAGVVVAWRAAEEGAGGVEAEVGKGRDRERDKDRDRLARPQTSPSPTVPLFLVLYDDGEDEWVSLGALPSDALRWKGSAALPLQLCAWSEAGQSKGGDPVAPASSPALPCGAGAVGWRLAALLPEQRAFVAGVVEAFEPDAQAYVLAEDGTAVAPASPRTPRPPAPVRALPAAHTLKWVHPPRASALDRVALAPARAPAAPAAPAAAAPGLARGSKPRAEEAQRSKGAKVAPLGEDPHAERPAQGLAASARAACAGELGRLLRAPSRWGGGAPASARGGDESEPGSPPPHAAAACAAPPLCIRASFLDRSDGRASMVRVFCSGAWRDGAAVSTTPAAAPSLVAAQAASPFEASRAPPAAGERSGRTGPGASAVRIMLRCVRLARSRLLDLEPVHGALLERGAGGSKALHAHRRHHHHRLARGGGQGGEAFTPRLGYGGKGLELHLKGLDHRSKGAIHHSKSLCHHSKGLDIYSAAPSSGDERDPDGGRGLSVKPAWQTWASADKSSTPVLSADASPADAPAPDAAAAPRGQPQPSPMQRGMSLGLEEGVLRAGQEEEESLVELSLVGEGLAL